QGARGRVESERVRERCGARIENRSDGRGGPEGVCRPPLAQGTGSPLVHRWITRCSQLRLEKRGRHQMPVEAGEQARGAWRAAATAGGRAPPTCARRTRAGPKADV